MIYHALSIYVPTTNMSLKCHICQLIHVHILDNYLRILISYEPLRNQQCDQQDCYTYIPHYWHIPLNKYDCQNGYVCYTARLMQSTQTSHLCARPPKINILHLFTVILQNTCQLQSSPSNATNMPNSQVTRYAFMGSMPVQWRQCYSPVI